MQHALALRLLDHPQRRAILDAEARIECFQLHPDLGGARRHNSFQPHHRRRSNQLQNAIHHPHRAFHQSQSRRHRSQSANHSGYGFRRLPVNPTSAHKKGSEPQPEPSASCPLLLNPQPFPVPLSLAQSVARRGRFRAARVVAAASPHRQPLVTAGRRRPPSPAGSRPPSSASKACTQSCIGCGCRAQSAARWLPLRSRWREKRHSARLLRQNSQRPPGFLFALLRPAVRWRRPSALHPRRSLAPPSSSVSGSPCPRRRSPPG